MINRIRIIVLFVSLLYISNSCENQGNENIEDIWKTVELRIKSWKERDKNSQLEIYHPNFRRWKNDTLLTKESFLNDWELIDMRIEKIEIERKDLMFFADSQLCVAHYKLVETMEWIGKDVNEKDFQIRYGDKWIENYSVSDYYVKEDRKWLYIGGDVKRTN